MENTGWGKELSLYVHNHFDSSRWDKVVLRPDDIIVSTYPKSGTTREQMTLLLLLHRLKEGINITELSPYVELVVEDIDDVTFRLEGQNHRRLIKSHLPLDCLPFVQTIKYIDVWRDPFDVAVSLFHHHNNANEKYYTAINSSRPPGTPEFPANNLPVNEWVVRWFEKDGYPYWSYWRHIRASWKLRHMENVAIYHFSDLWDPQEEVCKRARFLGLDLNKRLLGEVVRLSSFNHMKEVSHETAPYGGAIWGQGNGKEFFRFGKGGEWKTLLSEAEIERCWQALKNNLSPDIIGFLLR